MSTFSPITIRPTVAVVIFLLTPLIAFGQADAPLCQNTPRADLAKFTVHWDSFNMFGNTKQTYVERDYVQAGEAEACSITSVRGESRKIKRACNWTRLMSCELKLGNDPVSHKFNAGTSMQYGKLQWSGNETLRVSVKRGEATSAEPREVAVIKFNGNWVNGPNRGDSVSTLYYDRAWGILLKAEGAHDANKWGDTVTLIEVAP